MNPERVIPEPDEDGRLLYSPEEVRVGDRIRVYVASLTATDSGDVTPPIPFYDVCTVQRIHHREDGWQFVYGDGPRGCYFRLVKDTGKVEILPTPDQVLWALGNGRSPEADTIWAAMVLAGEAEERRQVLIVRERARWR